MKKLLQYGALAAFVGVGLGNAALADEATTAGGIKIKSDDGKFDASIGGRIHFDGEIVSPDDGARFNSGAGDAKSSFFFRRIFLSLGGHLYGFEYKMDYDLAGSANNNATTTVTPVCTTTSNGATPPVFTTTCTPSTVTVAAPSVIGTGFNDVWIEHAIFGNDALYIGQHKPWRSLDELASNNNTPFMERNVASATGVYGGRDYTEGLYYRWNHSFTGNDQLFLGGSFYSLEKLSNQVTQGTGYNARVAYAPFTAKDFWLHFGANYSSENADNGGFGLSSTYLYAGRQGPTATIANYATSGALGGAGGNPHADTWQLEYAGVFGPGFLQAEYTDAEYHKRNFQRDDVLAYSITGAFTVTGESRGYDKNTQTYTNIKPKRPWGAVELAVRYDHEQGKPKPGPGTGATGCAGTAVAGKTPAYAAGSNGTCAVSVITAGVNYYFNPAVRLMLNYEHGEFDLGDNGKDSPDAFMARLQLAF